MQAKKRYILVFISCAFLAYCYFGGYRLKRPRAPSTISASNVRSRHEHIAIPVHLPSFLSPIECNGIDDFAIAIDAHQDNDKGNGFSILARATNTNNNNNNNNVYHQGSQLSAIATFQTNSKLNGT